MADQQAGRAQAAFPAGLTARSVLLLVLGLVGLALRLAAVFMPRASLAVLVILFGSFILAEGGASIVVGLWRIPRQGMWPVSFLRGALGVGLGVALLGASIATLTMMSRAAGAWMLGSGALDLAVAGGALRGEGGAPLTAVGGLSVLSGLFLMVWPIDEPLFLVLWIAGYAILSGILLLVRVTRIL